MNTLFLDLELLHRLDRTGELLRLRAAEKRHKAVQGLLLAGDLFLESVLDLFGLLRRRRHDDGEGKLVQAH